MAKRNRANDKIYAVHADFGLKANKEFRLMEECYLLSAEVQGLRSKLALTEEIARANNADWETI